MATKNETIVIPAIEKATATIKVVGDSPLIMHKWSEKAKKEMLDKQMKVARSSGKEAKNPVADFIDSMYWLTDKPEEMTEEAFDKAVSEGARFGFPSVAFKASAIAGAYRAGIIKNKVSMQGAFMIMGELVEIKSDAPKMREDMVKVGMGTADLRYRGEFDNWSALLTVTYYPGIISLENIINLINVGGFTCGVGEWRIEKGGSFGMFHVE